MCDDLVFVDVVANETDQKIRMETKGLRFGDLVWQKKKLDKKLSLIEMFSFFYG